MLSGNESNVSVRIVKPRNAIYIFDKAILPSKKPIIIGKITIKAEAFSSHPINKVEFYVDDELKFIDDASPYQWLWNERAFGEYEIKVIAHDKYSDEATDEINVWVMNL